MTKMTRFTDLPPSQQAGILSSDEQFRRFVAVQRNLATCRQSTVTASFAAEFIRLQCGVNSRADLNTNPAAATRFTALRTDFDAWRGRIAQQR